ACRAAVGDDPPAPGIAFLDQKLARGDEVGEGVELLLALAVGVPAITLVLAAADVGDGEDETAIDEAEPAGREACRHGDAVGAIAVEEERRGAVERRPLLVEQRNGHALP